MSRPKPIILLEHVNKQNYRAEQVLAANAIWVVLFNSKPFSLKSLHSILNNPGPKYKKTSFTNPGHAYSLAKKLNSLYETDKFTVIKIDQFDV